MSLLSWILLRNRPYMFQFSGYFHKLGIKKRENILNYNFKFVQTLGIF